ncbi:TIGR03758 family integrating conjugative element protein [Pseudomonas sp. 21LCFQ010]|uniref:TIGR03758 family integrating conjugative element protein n=1 Tax=Pseudomonas sp. 21LCFQ010 TaxID=2957506 RepID=UPI002096DF28|nr:TIGR03758 family integrating conjugative element protein [Pseudomonas sp. 21LCFQ010]MCO8163879.1 TIGR03758 family integrating conjugative element protein [Pseudomonas sp. 21LCFQ010]
MSMTPAQTSAFQAGGGFLPQDSTLLFVGAALVLALIFAAWALGSGFRGWSKGGLDFEQLALLGLKLMLFFSVLSYFLLR